jgi:cysteine synthase
MPKLIKDKNFEIIKKNAARCRAHGIILPTIRQQMDPRLIPDSLKEQIARVEMDDLSPLNLFRITWKNDVHSGKFGEPNFLEIPSSITGVKARIFGLIGKYFPTGAHKVGAAYGCLLPLLVSGQFDPQTQKSVWPSTGNYCRGGAFDAALLDCPAVAVLPEGMSQERFAWLRKINAEIILTPGSESNVKEIYDKCEELSHDPTYAILNHFEEPGNSFWNYQVTGSAIYDAFGIVKKDRDRLAAFISASGSAGTIAAGDFLKKHDPQTMITAAEALQCPTMLNNGFGEHRIEGIGDKHIPWVHNVRSTDNVAAIDDEDCIRLLRLFNEPAGHDYLRKLGVEEAVIEKLPLLGISSIANLLAAIKTAKYYEMGEDDLLFTCFTDSATMYASRLEEQRRAKGDYETLDAAVDMGVCLLSQSYDNFLELSYQDKKRIHNLKYFTWVEQQGRSEEELRRQWDPDYWHETFEENLDELDEAINEFNSL